MVMTDTLGFISFIEVVSSCLWGIAFLLLCGQFGFLHSPSCPQNTILFWFLHILILCSYVNNFLFHSVLGPLLVVVRGYSWLCI